MAILDSGSRRAFDSGAVRDIQEGKGRCDLLPLEIIAYFLPDNYQRVFLIQLARAQKENDISYLQAAAVTIAANFFHSVAEACLEVAVHFEEGAKKYGDNNWQKGLPVLHGAGCYLDCAVRHFLKHLRGDTDERHDRATLWNLLCAIWTMKNIPDTPIELPEEKVDNRWHH